MLVQDFRIVLEMAWVGVDFTLMADYWEMFWGRADFIVEWEFHHLMCRTDYLEVIEDWGMFGKLLLLLILIEYCSRKIKKCLGCGSEKVDFVLR